MLTQQQLKCALTYDMVSGVFTRRRGKTGGFNEGDIAGWTDNGGYIRLKVNGVTHLAARLAYLYVAGEVPSGQIDHIDGDRQNNAWANLRDVTPKQNAMNRCIPKNNTTGVIGVHWHKAVAKWYATIKVGGDSKYLGVFEDWFEAVCTRKSAENKHNFHPNHGRAA